MVFYYGSFMIFVWEFVRIYWFWFVVISGVWYDYMDFVIKCYVSGDVKVFYMVDYGVVGFRIDDDKMLVLFGVDEEVSEDLLR